MVIDFRNFIKNVIVEELHPELRSLATTSSGHQPKQNLLAKKIKELTTRGERTGIEGNMPHGSARAYLKHTEPHEITLDGHKTHIPTGMKVAIRSTLDKHHNAKEHEGKSLGALQNHAEGGDHWANSNYRILSQGDHPNHFHSNKESGIFPPLLDHDHENHEWTHVGHARDIQPGEFRKNTKTPEHPKGISHKDFVDALVRHHERNNGAHWTGNKEKEQHLDHIDKHPLVQKFQDYHGNSGNPPYDYRQKKNMGIFEHPDGSHHIVARDHGFNTEVQHAYGDARRRQHDDARRKEDLRCRGF